MASKVYDCIGNNEHRFHIVSLSIIPKKKTNQDGKTKKKRSRFKKEKKMNRNLPMREIPVPLKSKGQIDEQ